LSNPVVDPVGISLYEEIAAGRQHFEPESKLIAQKKFGRLVMGGDGADWASFFTLQKLLVQQTARTLCRRPFSKSLC
jgi:hypothetical protein